MVKKLLKKWYLLPIAIYIIMLLLKTIALTYVAPIELSEGDKKSGILKSKSFNLKVTCSYIGGKNDAYKYAVESIPKGLLDEKWDSLTDLLYARPIGMIFGNYDFDEEKELLILGCEAGLSKSVIPDLIKNIQKYNYKDISYMGYYDFTSSGFQFKRIHDSPFFLVIKNEYIDGALVISEIWVFCFFVIVTGILMLFNYLMSKLIRYLRNKNDLV